MTSDNYTTTSCLIFCTASEDTEYVHQPHCDNKWQLHQHLRYLLHYETLLYWTNSSCNYNNVKSMVMLLKVNRPYRSCEHSSVFSVNTTQTKVESSCDWNSATKDALLLNMTLPQLNADGENFATVLSADAHIFGLCLGLIFKLIFKHNIIVSADAHIFCVYFYLIFKQ